MDPLLDKAIRLTRECLSMVHDGHLEEFASLETERRQVLDRVLAAGYDRSHKQGLDELHQAGLALEAELKDVLGKSPQVKGLDYGKTDEPGSYSLLA